MTSVKVQEALSQAVSIALDAADATIEIDWTQNPGSDRERDLRLAIIRRIEMQTATEGFDAARFKLAAIKAALDNQPAPERDEVTHIASDTYYALQRLVDFDDEIVGEDLYDALEWWEAATDAEAAAKRRLKRDALSNGLVSTLDPPT